MAAFTASLTFIVVFGFTKALTNLAAGGLSDRYGRKPVLIAGWLIGIPVPLLLIWAPSWGWVIAANVLLGVNQGLTWSTTIVMKGAVVDAPVAARTCRTGIRAVPEVTETVVGYDEAARTLTYEATDGVPAFVTLARNRW